jgi:hypothetical protein
MGIIENLTTGQILVVAVAKDHQLGETLVMTRTQTTIQVQAITWK